MNQRTENIPVMSLVHGIELLNRVTRCPLN